MKSKSRIIKAGDCFELVSVNDIGITWFALMDIGEIVQVSMDKDFYIEELGDRDSLILVGDIKPMKINGCYMTYLGNMGE